MPAMWELSGSGDFDVSIDAVSCDKQYFLQGIDDEGAAEVYALKNTLPRFRRLARQSLRASRVGPQEWSITVKYGTAPVGLGENKPPDGAGNLGSEWSFDTTGQTIHITQSLATRSKTKRAALGDTGLTEKGDDKNAYTLDNKRAIGLSQDRVEGCEKVAPQFQWSLEATFANVTGQYLTTLTALTGTVNAQPFFGFPSGSTLFLGASGRFTADGRWRLTFKFASLPNQTNIRISDKIVVPEKRGWEHLWVGYLPELVGNKILQVPDAAYVEVIYGAAEFYYLELGGSPPPLVPERRDRVDLNKAGRDNQAALGEFGKGSIVINADGSVIIDGCYVPPQ